MIVTSLPDERTDAERSAMVASMEGAVIRQVNDDARIFPREKDDAAQECRIGLWKASATYDPRAKTKWSTYSIDVIKTVLRRIAVGGSRHPDPAARFADRQEDSLVGREVEPLDALIAAEEAAGLTQDDMEPFVRLFTEAALAGKLSKLDTRHELHRPTAAKLFERPMHADILAGLSVADVAAKYRRPVTAVRLHCRDAIRLWRPEYTTQSKSDAAVLALYRECLASGTPPTDQPPPVGTRKLVEMVVIDHMTPAEIADRTGYTAGVVRRILQQAVARLTGEPFPHELTDKGRREAEKAAAGLIDTPAAADRRRAKKASADRLAANLDAAKARAANPAPEPATAA